MKSHDVDYVKDVESQNETLQNKLDETLVKLQALETQCARFDYIPTFVVYTDRTINKTCCNLDGVFIHQCLLSAFEIITDEVEDIIHMDVQKKKKRNKNATIGHIYLESWYLGSKQRNYDIDVKYWSQCGKYTINCRIRETTNICWDEDADMFYFAHIPQNEKVVLKKLYEILIDFKSTSKHINMNVANRAIAYKEKR